MSTYPEAEQVPWAHNTGDGPTYFYGINQPGAVVLHVMEGYKSTARQWAISGHYGASWHYTVGRDGSVMQHLRHEDGGYHAGIPTTAPAPTWALWRGHGQNVNTYTIGIEHEGFSGDGFTEAQRTSSRNLCRWLAQELGIAYDREHFPAHAEIDLVNRPNDFAPPAEREAFYQYLFEEEEMTDEQFAEKWTALMGQLFPVYLRLAFEEVDGNFSDRPDIPMTFPYKPWLNDIAARVRTIPGVSHDG